MTIQKSSNAQERKNLQNKILADVAKAQRNVKEYNYSERLEFFYSYTLTESFIEEIQLQAFTDFGINLIIIDAKRIAAQAEKLPELYKSILVQSGYDKIKVKSYEISEKINYFMIL